MPAASRSTAPCSPNAQHFIPAHLRNIGLVAQDGALFPHLSVADNIGFGLGRVPDREDRILALMDMVELDRAYARPASA